MFLEDRFRYDVDRVGFLKKIFNISFQLIEVIGYFQFFRNLVLIFKVFMFFDRGKRSNFVFGVKKLYLVIKQVLIN